MEIRYKLYPYPVLSSFSDDYQESNFTTEIISRLEGYVLCIDFHADLDNIPLLNLIHNQKAKFSYHLECAQTGYRIVLSTTENELSYSISNELINGRLQICPFIVAADDLSSYENINFHQDYHGKKFSIESGCIMAVGKQVNIDIDKAKTNLTYTPSVFTIIKNDDENALGMIVDMDQRKIVIKLREQEFYNFKSLQDDPYVQPVLNSLVITPALTYVLEEVDKRDPNERYTEYSSYAWYRAIKRSLAEKFHYDIDNDKLSDRKNILSIAQEIIDTPIRNALSYLSSSAGATSEGENL